jgi:hypothetical protein
VQEAASASASNTDYKIDFVDSSLGNGAYQAATERAGPVFSGAGSPQDQPKTNMFQLKHYQRFFDIDTVVSSTRLCPQSIQ